MRTVAVFVSIMAMGAVCAEAEMKEHAPEKTYEGELVKFPGAWSFQLPRSAIILVNDQELIDLATDPDKTMNLATGHKPWEVSLRKICEEPKASGAPTLIIAFDHFFSQYRPGQDAPRQLTPDMDEYVNYISIIGKFAADYGLGLELSLLSPLEIGPAYEKATGESGRWVHYRKGLRDPASGAYSVELWQQRKWANNKGVIDVADAGVRVFAFREERAHASPYRVVDPINIIDISETAQVEVYDGLATGNSRRIRIHGAGRAEIGPLDRVMVLQQYKTPEMDYFSPNAAAYLRNLLDKYLNAGINFHAFYSDEMHIQQDWNYFSHHDHGQFAMRYVTPNLAKRFADRYGEQYRDFDKYMVYFIYGQEDFANDVHANEGASHVFGASPEHLAETALFRSRYYKMLQDDVVDLFLGARIYAENKVGHRIDTRAHATWAESPTIDCWRTAAGRANASKYEYTPDFVWSNTVHQSAAACSDYFKWGEYLTGTGNDHPEGGYLDRDYFGLALACSTGIVNEIPYSYCGHWGHPQPVMERRTALQNAFGTAGQPHFGLVQDMQHRDVEVLMLYPLDLVSVEERFGSWMTQYGYANYITQAKLVEMGTVKDGAVELAGRRFTTLVALFEPFPSEKLLALMAELSNQGGRAIWSGPPPLFSAEGKPIFERWRAIFGIESEPAAAAGMAAPGRRITFEGALRGVEPQIVLTDFLVDRFYPVKSATDTEVIARSGEHILGTLRRTEKRGVRAYLGYRPRDDQAGSLGYETKNWFEVLTALGAYPPTGKFNGINDNTEYVSRTEDYVVCHFPNGALTFAPHLRDLEESWPGDFSRDEEADKALVEDLALPSDRLDLKDCKVNGHVVSYNGTGAMAVRVNAQGELLAFAGGMTEHVTVDGKRFDLGGPAFHLFAFGPIPKERQVTNGAVAVLIAHGAGELRVPIAGVPENVEWVAQGPAPGSRAEAVASRREDSAFIVSITPALNGRWIYAVPK